MKKIFHKISSFSLALIVLLSTVSFTVESHYCGNILVDSSFFGDVETCGMEVHDHLPSSECDISKKDCCNDVKDTVEGQDDLKMSFHTLDKVQQIFVAAFIHSYINLFEDQDADINSFRDYVPPFLIQDIQKLHETYLI
ncbi:MAG: HYC_CC_PP family protein [Gelidibacter sp.]